MGAKVGSSKGSKMWSVPWGERGAGAGMAGGEPTLASALVGEIAMRAEVACIAVKGTAEAAARLHFRGGM
jgi:hypothetical protein